MCKKNIHFIKHLQREIQIDQRYERWSVRERERQTETDRETERERETMVFAKKMFTVSRLHEHKPSMARENGFSDWS